VVASYCTVVALLYAFLAVWGALPLAGDEPLQWRGLGRTYFEALTRVPRQVLIASAAFFGGIIAAVSLYRAWQLSQGGPAIAELLGADYVDPARCTPSERRLQNVVEEMSIASGIAVPPVYVLPHDDAINALVAGHSPNEAAIIVTKGALHKLSRDELQGVMGHEYSHILNGDMALNLRVAAVLAGLSWLGDRGEEMVWRAADQMRKQDDGSPAAVPATIGAAAAFIGFPGVFAADAIRSAISRERELLADQASVQFTRNPDGIAGALDSILATRSSTMVRAAHAAELSHMFFAPVATRWWSWPTHPPIEKRIRRAHPRFARAQYRERRHGTRQEVAVIDGRGEVVKAVHSGLVAAPTAQHVDYAKRLLQALPARLREALHKSDEAEMVMFALAGGTGLDARRGADYVARMKVLEPLLAGVARNHMLTLAELAVPAIKEQRQKERDRFLDDLAAVVEADRRLTHPEFVLFTYLRQRLREGAGQPIPAQFRKVDELRPEAHAVLSLVAMAAGAGAQAAYERGARILNLQGMKPLGQGELDINAIRDALERLRRLAPFAKPAVLKACVEASTADGQVHLAEAELVRMVAATLDCPVPPTITA
jgi:Zn-dependent protease with chaperone function